MRTLADSLGRVERKARLSPLGSGFMWVTPVLCLAGFLRFYRIDGYGLWSDEFVTLLIFFHPILVGIDPILLRTSPAHAPSLFPVDQGGDRLVWSE